MGHDTTSKRKYKHLTEVERYKIEGYCKAKMTAREIAALLGKSERTIQRERKRGTVIQMNSDLTMRREYLGDYAQLKHREAGRKKGPKRKLAAVPELAAHLEKMIKGERKGETMSPDAVVGRMNLLGEFAAYGVRVCAKTVYNAIDAGLFPHLSNKDLPEKRNRGKGEYKRVGVAHNNTKGRSIEERPGAVEKREEAGHWEIDCIVSGAEKGTAALLTLTERKSRRDLAFKLKEKTQAEVLRVVNHIERVLGSPSFREAFRSITADNGPEFLDFKGLEKSAFGKAQRTTIYYAHPYSSWERGSNERMNRMLRRFVPKGCDISKIPLWKIKHAQDWLNNYPRRSLGYRTPNEVAAETGLWDKASTL
jgi:IS30 family transposase